MSGMSISPSGLRDWLLGSTALLCLFSPAATRAQTVAPNAQPGGGVVVAGQAQISQSGNTTTITQGTDRAALNWQQFNVGSQAQVNFQQPSSASWTLNRVVGPDPSVIAGRVTANGGIALVNPSGVVFAQGAQVNVGSLIASAAGISNENFMAGRMVFDQAPKPGARVENHGEITVAERGMAALVAPGASNSGIIRARMGRVALAGAETYTLDMAGDGLLAIDVTQAVRKAPDGATALVTNSGTIDASGGSVLLTAHAASGLLEDLVRNTGTVSAAAAGGRAGQVALTAEGGGVVQAGTVSATGGAGEAGGTIALRGSTATTLAAGSATDASGGTGGGTVLVGTTGIGRNQTMSARTTVARGAAVKANATTRGKGGTVAVNSTASTVAAGEIAARGGAQGGDGGFIELSGQGAISLSAGLDLAAPAGVAGTLLIDPVSIEVKETVSGGAAEPDNEYAATSGSGTLEIDNNWLNGKTNVLLEATQNIGFSAAISGITTLRLQAGGDISQTAAGTIQATNLVITGPSGTGGAASVTLGQANNVGTLAATVSGNLTLNNGVNALTLNTSSAANFALTTTSTVTVAGTLTGNVAVATGSLVNNSGSIITGNVSAGANLTNSGRIGTDSATALTVAAGGVLTNDGSIAAQSVTVTAGSITNNGAIRAGAGAATLSATAGSVSNAGTIEAAGDASGAASIAITAAQNVTNSGTISATASTSDRAATATTSVIATAGDVSNGGTISAGASTSSADATATAMATTRVTAGGTGGISHTGGQISASAAKSATVILTADTLNLGAPVLARNGGTVALVPASDTRSITLGGTADTADSLSLTSAELALIDTRAAGATVAATAGALLIGKPNGGAITLVSDLNLRNVAAELRLEGASVAGGAFALDVARLSGHIRDNVNLAMNTTTNTRAEHDVDELRDFQAGGDFALSLEAGERLEVTREASGASVLALGDSYVAVPGLRVGSGKLVTLAADDLAITSAPQGEAMTIQAPGGTIRLLPVTAERDITLGGTATGTLSLDSTELASLGGGLVNGAQAPAARLRIGSDAAGDITLVGDVALRDGGTTRVTALELASGAAISQTGGTLSAEALAARGASIALGSQNNRIDRIVQARQDDTLLTADLGREDGAGRALGLIATDGDITLRTSTGLDIQADLLTDAPQLRAVRDVLSIEDGTTVLGDRILQGGRTITLTLTGDSALSISNGAKLRAPGGSVVLDGNTDAGIPAVDLSGGQLPADCSDCASAGGLTLRRPDDYVLTSAVSGLGSLTVIAGGDITQSDALNIGTLSVRSGNGSVTLDNAGNSILRLRDSSAASNFSITAGDLRITGVAEGTSGISAGSDVTITANALDIRNTVESNGTVTMKPLSNGRAVEFGAEAQNTAALSLSRNELLGFSTADGETSARVRASALVLGTREAGMVTQGEQALDFTAASGAPATLRVEGAALIQQGALDKTADAGTNFTSSSTLKAGALAVGTLTGLVGSQGTDSAIWLGADNRIGTANDLKLSRGSDVGSQAVTLPGGLVADAVTLRQDEGAALAVGADGVTAPDAGRITLVADSLALGGPLATSGGTVELLPATRGRGVVLGGGTEQADSLTLTAAELEQIATGTGLLRIGRSEDVAVTGRDGRAAESAAEKARQAGDITLAGPMDLTGHAGTLELFAGAGADLNGRITQAEDAVLTVQNLAGEARLAVRLDAADNRVATLAARRDDPSLSFRAGTLATTAEAAVFSLRTVQAEGLAVASAVTAGMGVDGTQRSGDGTPLTGGTLRLEANNLALDGALRVPVGTVALVPVDARDVRLGGAADTPGSFSLTNTELALIDTRGLGAAGAATAGVLLVGGPDGGAILLVSDLALRDVAAELRLEGKSVEGGAFALDVGRLSGRIVEDVNLAMNRNPEALAAHKVDELRDFSAGGDFALRLEPGRALAVTREASGASDLALTFNDSDNNRYEAVPGLRVGAVKLVTLAADDLAITSAPQGGAMTIQAPGGTIRLLPVTAGRDITLGGAADGTLSLDSAELASLGGGLGNGVQTPAARLRIGSVAAGDITLAGDVSLRDDSTSRITALELVSGRSDAAGILQTTGTHIIWADELAASVLVDGPVAPSRSIALGNGNRIIRIVQATEDGTLLTAKPNRTEEGRALGLRATTGDITLNTVTDLDIQASAWASRNPSSTGLLTITAGGSIMLQSGRVLLVEQGADGAARLSLTAGGNITNVGTILADAATSSVTVEAGGRIATSGRIEATGGDVSLTARGADDGATAALAQTAGLIRAGSGTLTLQAEGGSIVQSGDAPRLEGRSLSAEATGRIDLRSATGEARHNLLADPAGADGAGTLLRLVAGGEARLLLAGSLAATGEAAATGALTIDVARALTLSGLDLSVTGGEATLGLRAGTTLEASGSLLRGGAAGLVAGEGLALRNSTLAAETLTAQAGTALLLDGVTLRLGRAAAFGAPQGIGTGAESVVQAAGSTLPLVMFDVRAGTDLAQLVRLAPDQPGVAPEMQPTQVSTLREPEGSFSPGATNRAAGSIALNLRAGAAPVFLLLDGGTAQGTLQAGRLGVLGSGGQIELSGSLGGIEGSGAARLGRLSFALESGGRQPLAASSEYRFNNCVLGSLNCSVLALVQPLPVPTANIIALQLAAPKQDPDSLLPNVTEEDY